jgi:hypothetical protein
MARAECLLFRRRGRNRKRGFLAPYVGTAEASSSTCGGPFSMEELGWIPTLSLLKMLLDGGGTEAITLPQNNLNPAF